MEIEIADLSGSPVSLLPRPDFIAKLAVNWTGRLVSCRSIWPSAYDPGNPFADAILDNTPLKSAEWATLFAYMHRRFGPPNVGGDNSKDLSARWLLTSPEPNLFLVVGPSLSGSWFSFAPYFLMNEGASLRNLEISKERRAEIDTAYRDVLLDLLRPVCVRDHNINALGELDDDDPLLEYDEDAGQSPFGVDQHPSCGWPSPPGLIGGEEWGRLCGLLRDLGNGDVALGRTAAIDALSKLLDEPAPVAPEEGLAL